MTPQKEKPRSLVEGIGALRNRPGWAGVKTQCNATATDVLPVDQASPTTPRRLVQTASLDDLVRAYAQGVRHPFATHLIDGARWFICQRCGHASINGGTARVVDAWRWNCHRCRHTGTRYAIENEVLGNAAMIEALYELTDAA